MGSIAKFRDPRQAQDAKPGKSPRVLNLEERCLAPLENELEMGASVDDAVALLKKEPDFAKRFDEAFGEAGGVTKPRLAKALAAFVRSLAAREAPYAAYLAGDAAALSADAARGLEIFTKRGCADCHSGPR